jgi:hypothetical protein
MLRAQFLAKRRKFQRINNAKLAEMMKLKKKKKKTNNDNVP